MNVVNQLKRLPMIVKLLILVIVLKVMMGTREGFKEGITASTYNPLSRTYYFFDNTGNYYKKKRGKNITSEGLNENFEEGMPSNIDSAVFSLGSGSGRKPTGTYYFFSGNDVYIKKYGKSDVIQKLSKDDGWKEA